jgi:hypothetical protein
MLRSEYSYQYRNSAVVPTEASPASTLGLGRVKTLPQGVGWLQLSAWGAFDANGRHWHLGAAVEVPGPCSRPEKLQSRYASIAVMSGLMPMMFITRVRL